MITPRINCISRDKRPLPGHPKQRMVHRISLHRSQQEHRLTVDGYEAERIRFRLGGRSWREVVRAELRGPVHDLGVVLALDARAHVGRGEEACAGEGIEDGVHAEVVIRVVVGREDGRELCEKSRGC